MSRSGLALTALETLERLDTLGFVCPITRLLLTISFYLLTFERSTVNCSSPVCMIERPLCALFQVDVFALVRSWRTRREQVVRSVAQYEHLLQVACALLDDRHRHRHRHRHGHIVRADNSRGGGNGHDHDNGGDADADADARLARNLLLIQVDADGDGPQERSQWAAQGSRSDLLELARPTTPKYKLTD